MSAYKFSNNPLPDSGPYIYPDLWAIEKTTGPNRLIIAPSRDQIGLLMELAGVLPEPFGILYVLLVSRCDNVPGRYQSPYPCDRQETEAFVRQFHEYFELDGRHHLWLISVPSSATLVYDNHNVIYAYGPLEEFKRILTRRGFKEGSVRFPVPHTHNYNSEFDEEEKKILGHWDWIRFPLMEDDDP